MKSGIICYNCGKLARENESYWIRLKDYKQMEPSQAFIDVPRGATTEEIEELKNKLEKMPKKIKVKICSDCASIAGYRTKKPKAQAVAELKYKRVAL